MTTLDVLFAAIGLIAAASAVLAVTTHHLVHAALWLVVTLGTLAGCYLVLGAELVALVQLLVYVGAVVVLVLFALMLTRAPIGPSPEHTSGPVQRVAAAVAGAGVAGLLGAVLLTALGGTLVSTREGRTHGVAEQLFGTWVWPFELLSLLLLVALIAAFAVSRMPSATGAEESSAERWADEAVEVP
ncbi:MAG: NADH-quinone oxidoreductase subunit J family protein [Oryzihumus sp.]